MSGVKTQAEEPLELVICPECQAVGGASAKKCWLCGRTMDSPFQAGAAPQLAPARSDPSLGMVLNVSLAVMAVLLVVVTFAAGFVEPVYGIALGAVLFPAIGVTLITGLVSRAGGKAMSPLARVAVFLKSVAVMFGVAVVLAAIAVIVAVAVIVSLFIAFFEDCIKILSG